MPPNNPLTTWGNEKTMNLNMLLLTNIQSSPYFKVNLFELKTYHEVIDEIFYRVGHLEPWEKGSRKTAGQTGMCGGVRGVGAGGIVSSAFCLLYKLFTLKLTKKQVIGLITHKDSPYIRGLGFMYIRYTQPPADLWPWYEDYLDDEEEIDVKAGGGHIMTIGEMLRQWLVKLEWYSTLFPRIPVPIEKDIAARFKTRPVINPHLEPEPEHIPDNQVSFGEAEKQGASNIREVVHGNRNGRGNRNGDFKGREDDYLARSHRSPIPRRPSPNHRSSRPSPVHRQSAIRRSRTPPPRRSPPRQERSTSFERALARERERQQLEHKSRSRSRSRERKERKVRRSPSQERTSNLKKNHKPQDRSKEKQDRSKEKKSREGNRDRYRDNHRDERSSKHKSRVKDRR